MNPGRRKLLTDAVALIRAASNADTFDVPATRAALMRLGVGFVEGNTNTMKLSGVTASCSWNAGEHLMLRWAANARTALLEDDDTPGTTEEEE